MYEYKPGRSTVTKKWKWPQLNTVDFLVRVTPDRRRSSKIFKLYLWGPNNQYVEYRQVFFQTKCAQRLLNDLGDLTEAVVECSYSTKIGEWQYHRLRTDKPHANFITVALQGLEVTCDNIDAECLRKGLLGSSNVHPARRSTGGSGSSAHTSNDIRTPSQTPDSVPRTTPDAIFSVPTPVDVRSTEGNTSPEYTDVIYDSPLIQTPVLGTPEIPVSNFKRKLNEEVEKLEVPDHDIKKQRTNTRL